MSVNPMPTTESTFVARPMSQQANSILHALNCPVSATPQVPAQPALAPTSQHPQPAPTQPAPYTASTRTSVSTCTQPTTVPIIPLPPDQLSSLQNPSQKPKSK